MEPELYKECLRLIAERDGLPHCSLLPAQMTEIISVEEELGMHLPHQYQEYLLRVGVGEEHGGLAIWYHLDVGRSGNLLEKRSSNPEENFLPVYDSLDGEVFGFCPNGSMTFQEKVFCFIEDEEKLEGAYGNLSGFLEDNLDCTEEEVEQARADLQMRNIS